MNEKGFQCGCGKHLTSLQQMPGHVVGKQHKRYFIHSKSALPENAVNEIENHITEDVTHSNRDSKMEKLQEESNAELLHHPV